MATIAGKEGISAMAKGLGGCAAFGTFFSIIDTIRNPALHNFTNVCIFGFACWALLWSAARLKQPSFATTPGAQATETVVGRCLGAPGWVRPAIWISLFLVMFCLVGALLEYHSELHLPARAARFVCAAIFALYFPTCQHVDCLARSILRRWYPDKAQVSISADGLWITGTEIPWHCIRAISPRSRWLKLMRVDTILVQAQGAKRPENIEIDLSDSVEDPKELYAKLRSAAAAHGARLLPEGEEFGAAKISLKETRERVRKARERTAEWRAGLPNEIAKTEAMLANAVSMIAEAEARVRELEAALAAGTGVQDQTEKQLELARASLRTRIALRESAERLLATQKSAWEKRS